MWPAINPPPPQSPPYAQMFGVWGATSCAETNKDGEFDIAKLHLSDIFHGIALIESICGAFLIQAGACVDISAARLKVKHSLMQHGED